MINRLPPADPTAPAIVINIGNTSLTIATWHEGQLKTPLSIPTNDQAAFDEAYKAQVKSIPKGRLGATVIGSVVPPVLDRIRSLVHDLQEKDPLVIGETIDFPIEVGVTDGTATIGADRVCAAAAAYERVQTGCIVIDFGTAVTVDLVDDEGMFCGGGILPGLHMQLRALHEFTAALPVVEPGIPELPYGRNTVEAMQVGVCRGLCGAVRGLVEAYASHLNHWPQVIATGGDVALIAPQCDFLDTLVDHLTLHGIGVAYDKHLESWGGA